ncbi:MAG: hypothetical protein KJ887_04045 [Candidatus Omnitrophica bacterium]|nr:hypothetical protein [Candidatus Omnitrophota bacterium]MBU1047491.1 hypothetical protein [Candidatus Omnitrophota bacterium]MBU1767749.1 hypothetical protein [Candidatus Omnitrophota bacterium]MBU1888854.1 hypothetical protein [Candidatus Omnitrophota bacterium]
MQKKQSGSNFTDFLRGSFIFLKFLFPIAIVIVLVSVFAGLFPYVIVIGTPITVAYILYRFLVFLGAKARHNTKIEKIK